MIRWRSARFLSDTRSGWPVVFRSAMTYLPSRCCCLAMAAAAAISSSDSPSSSALSLTTISSAFRSFGRFWTKVVWRVATSAFRAFIFVFSASLRRAPARTKLL